LPSNIVYTQGKAEQIIAPKRLELASYLRCVFSPLGELRRWAASRIVEDVPKL
jgi:hypothetical protein